MLLRDLMNLINQKLEISIDCQGNFIASFPWGWVGEGGMKYGVCGRSVSVGGAVHDYCGKIAGKLLIIDKPENLGGRKEFQIPARVIA